MSTPPTGLLGSAELIDALRHLPENLQKKVFRRWVIRKAREIAAATKAAAPRGKTGNLRAGIVAKSSSAVTLRKLQSMARAVVIGKKPAHHFHIINRGTPAGLNKSGNRRGKGLRANPFMEQAAVPLLARVRGEVSADLAREVQRALDQAMKRTLRHVR
jgi:hypothetical protein